MNDVVPCGLYVTDLFDMAAATMAVGQASTSTIDTWWLTRLPAAQLTRRQQVMRVMVRPEVGLVVVMIAVRSVMSRASGRWSKTISVPVSRPRRSR